ncbi:MAG: prephenate dehydrogenase/arogenate dehydrogenase family protein [Opitutaceae bacterium]|nr:prephenate dehydrogenase/arogenate dehydrogenase family protein [Opitutaceae bacterium]
MPAVAQLAILAPGLLGGSVARAARARGAAQRIVIWARRPETRDALRGQPWVDAVVATPAEAVREASLVVIAAPVDRIVPLAREIAPALPPGAVVTDVGSVKGPLCAPATEAIGPKAHFVGSHPMAGSEQTGWENGSAELFNGRPCFVTPLPGAAPAAVAMVAGFWTTLGAGVVNAAPAEHDRIVAHISHLPQVAASALCSFLAGADPRWRDHAGGGLRDTTRIAASDPALWREILASNRAEVLASLHAYRAELDLFMKALESGDDAAVAARMERGRAYRAGFRPPPPANR